ncbi:protein FAR1-RELATED SEQUENCE 5-like [Gossypium australe]|uniref:Protein FAR1-RELATED SEQUENCE 5-like n=1 Tax=Gossypium australe TaxID=47621 RepID=A0A5B6WM59_9ROSI|nr:protein FAR1-RELATED SEQUENCE 5-like [Gossypium australe]
MEVSDSFKLVGVTEDALKLRLFPYSLRDRARAWLNSLPSDSTWQELPPRSKMKSLHFSNLMKNLYMRHVSSLRSYYVSALITAFLTAFKWRLSILVLVFILE